MSAPFDLHTALVIARSLLATRHPLMHEWIDRIAVVDDGGIISNATVPTLVAWRAWVSGDLQAGAASSERSIDWIEQHHIGPHHWGFDSYITAGWCRLSGGDVDGARELADEAVAIAEAIPLAWNQLQSAYLSARISLADGQPGDAMRIIEEIRETVPLPAPSPYVDRLIHVAAEAAIMAGRTDTAATFAGELAPGPYRNLVRARVEPLSDARLDDVLAERAAWPTMYRLQADAILATRSHSTAPSPALADLVERCAADGWVLPLLDLGPRAERTLRTLPLDQLHPRLAEAFDRSQAQRPAARTAPTLTPRELSLLELLPTHLSYAEMGERMYLSVNTVKSSLKSLYRKLEAHTRAEAVAAGRAFGLI
jgi:DNA-binding CsgD family transcriptional regulator